MNGNGQMEVHYTNNGFSYSETESFMDFFEGLAHVPANYSHTVPLLDQENLYWSMNMNAYKFGYSGPGCTSYYGTTYEVHDNFPRMDVGRRDWEYPSMENAENLSTTMDVQPDGSAVMGVHVMPEECIPSNSNTSSPQGAWQDDIDPDNMTYEELLDLGETVGTQSRGLSQELISLLPTSKCKFGSFFSRKKKSGERCVICQMRYKRGEKQMKLPCKHVYHSECITQWLGINKVCPVCNSEIFVDESRQ